MTHTHEPSTDAAAERQQRVLDAISLRYGDYMRAANGSDWKLDLDDGAIVLIEQSIYDGDYYLTNWNTPEDAADHHDSQQNPEDWPILRVLRIDEDGAAHTFDWDTKTTLTETSSRVQEL